MELLPVDVLERFVLSDNKTQVLQHLSPGSANYYFFAILNEQISHPTTTETTKEAALMKEAQNKFGRDHELFVVLARRRHLMSYDDADDTTQERLLAQLISDLQLEKKMAKYKEPASRGQSLPSTMPEQDVFEALDKAFTANPEHAASEAGAATAAWILDDPARYQKLSTGAVTRLLQTTFMPETLPGIVDILMHCTKNGDKKTPFGSIPVENALSVPQLEAYAAARPSIAESFAFHGRVLTSMAPDVPSGADESFRAELDAYHDQLWAYAPKLPEPLRCFGLGLSLAVLYYLAETGQEATDKAQAYFDEYIVNRPAVGCVVPLRGPIDTSGTPRPPHRDGAAVVCHPAVPHALRCPDMWGTMRRYLMLAIVRLDWDTTLYSGHIAQETLDRAAAEAAVLHDHSPEHAADVLGHAEVQRLVNARLLAVHASTPRLVSVGDDVTIIVDVKNTPSLTIRTFHLNSAAYYKAHGQEMPVTLPLDGYLPNRAETVHFAQSPAIQHREAIVAVPAAERGHYIIEVVGGGSAARCLVSVGHYQLVTVPTRHGTRLAALNQAGDIVDGAVLTVNGRDYPTSDGWALVPFSTTASPRVPVVIHMLHGAASLAFMGHPEEHYSLEGGLAVQHGGLVAGHKADVTGNVQLSVNGVPVPLTCIDQPLLRITCVDRDGTDTVKTLTPTLAPPDVVTADFPVPELTARVDVAFEGRVKVASTGKWQTVALSSSYAVGTRASHQETVQPFIGCGVDGWTVTLAGLNGEPVPGARLSIMLKTQLVQSAVIDLMTDSAGRVTLGHLGPEIDDVDVRYPTVQGSTTTASLRFRPHRTAPPSTGPVTVQAGEAFDVAVPLEATVSLVRRMNNVAVAIDELPNHGGVVTVPALDAGKFQLVVRGVAAYVRDVLAIDPRVTLPGTDTFVLVDERVAVQATLPDLNLTCAATKAPGDDPAASVVTVTGAVFGASEDARVHVVTATHLPRWTTDAMLGRVGSTRPPPTTLIHPATNLINGSPLDPEIAYVINRQAQEPRHGTTLPQPELLVLPTKREAITPGAGDGPMGRSGMMGKRMAAPCAASGYGLGGVMGGSASVEDGALPAEFVAPSTVLANQSIAEDGTFTITVPAAAEHAFVDVYVTDGRRVTHSTVWVPATPHPADVRYRTAHSPDTHLAALRGVSLLGPTYLGEYTVVDTSGAATATHAGLGKLYATYQMLSAGSQGASDLDKFSFILDWGSMTDAAKLAKYSQYACHELAFFIFIRDRAFFNQFLVPFLSTKLEPTFVDLFLVGADLASFIDDIDLLNVFEKALLARWLAEKGRATEAEAVCRHIGRQGPQEVDAATLNRVFNTVLSAADEVDEPEPEPEEPDEPMICMEDEEEESEEESEEEGDEDIDMFLCEDEVAMNAPPPPGAAGLMFSMAAPPPAPMSLSREHRMMELECMEEEMQEMSSMSFSKSKARKKSKAPTLFRRKEEARAPMARGGRRGMVSRDARDRMDMATIKQAQQQEEAPLFKQVEATKEYAEHNYYMTDPTPGLIPPSPFWAAWARHIVQHGFEAPFLTQHAALPAAIGNAPVNAMLLGLAVVGLPLTPVDPTVTLGRSGATISRTVAATTPTLLWRREVKTTTPPKKVHDSLIINWAIIDPTVPVEEDASATPLAPSAALAPGKVYAVDLAVTNISGKTINFDLLRQIPSGAIPVAGGFTSKADHVALQQFSSHKEVTQFYFPEPGQFTVTAPHACGAGAILARGATRKAIIVSPAVAAARSWGEVAANGSLDEVIEFIETDPMRSADLTLVCWRCVNKAAFTRITDALAARRLFSPAVWMYSFVHRVAPRLKEYLDRAPDARPVRRGVGPVFHSGLLDVDAVRPTVTFTPVVPQRVFVAPDAPGHADRFPVLQAEYQAVLARLAFIRSPTAADLLEPCYHLLISGHIDQAEAVHARIQALMADDLRDTPPMTHDGRPAPMACMCDRCDQPISAKRYASVLDPTHDVCPECRKPASQDAPAPTPTTVGLPHFPFVSVPPYLGLPGEVQVDYITAYLDLLGESDNMEAARAVAAKYRDFPLTDWRARFATLAAQIADIDGLTVEAAEGEAPPPPAPELDVAVNGHRVVLTTKQLGTVTLQYHSIALERLFSKKPFFQGGAVEGALPAVLPHHIQTVAIADHVTTVDMPTEMAAADCQIIARADGLTGTCIHMAGALQLLPSVQAGQVRVVDAARRPVAGVYVKVFVKTPDIPDGKFHKDGFTDRRGWFDYASCSSALPGIQQYAILANKGSSALKIVNPPLT